MSDFEPFRDVAGFSGARLARIDRMMLGAVAQGHIPGAVLLIERQGQSVMNRAWGFRDREAGTAMTLDTIFRIYSMTKPIVSLAALMLAAEGRLQLAQPVSDFIPAFADIRLLRDRRLVAPREAPTVLDLLRHTSGLTYQANGGPVADLYRQANLFSAGMTNAEFADRLATLPFAHEPGRVWEYSHATDVLGRVVEVVAGRTLSAVLQKRILAPLGMAETSFRLATDQDYRLAQPLTGDTLGSARGALFDPCGPRAFEAGGMGLVSTVADYARFARMLLNAGTLDGVVLASKRLMRFMASDHIGPATGIIKLPGYMPGAAYGFGLGVAVRLESGASASPGSVGEFTWSGVAGTYFWVDPEEDMFAILMTQAPRERVRMRTIVRTMVYDALVESDSGLRPGRQRPWSA